MNVTRCPTCKTPLLPGDVLECLTCGRRFVPRMWLSAEGVVWRLVDIDLAADLHLLDTAA